jgi:DtxR family Mn-dependent transcriptional regulator
VVDPIPALIGALLFVGVTSAFFLPDRGIYARVLRFRRIRDRVRVEDALKHAYDCETRATACTVQSLAGALGTTTDRAAALAERLENTGLLSQGESGVVLTAAGRAYALRVIRAHRLWERHLSDETGFSATDWHREAERREHLLTDEDLEALASRLGDPRWDPHGDPIPTEAGEVAAPPGFPLTGLGAGASGEIVHIEDEPGSVYAQIVAAGLFPGMALTVTAVDGDRIEVTTGSGTLALTPLVAANVSVVRLPEATPVPAATLADLDIGDVAEVIDLSPACRGVERRRLMDLGIVPGTVIGAELRAASGDPTGYRVRGSVIALRESQAELILVSRRAEDR